MHMSWRRLQRLQHLSKPLLQRLQHLTKPLLSGGLEEYVVAPPATPATPAKSPASPASEQEEVLRVEEQLRVEEDEDEELGKAVELFDAAGFVAMLRVVSSPQVPKNTELNLK